MGCPGTFGGLWVLEVTVMRVWVIHTEKGLQHPLGVIRGYFWRLQGIRGGSEPQSPLPSQ